MTGATSPGRFTASRAAACWRDSAKWNADGRQRALPRHSRGWTGSSVGSLALLARLYQLGSDESITRTRGAKRLPEFSSSSTASKSEEENWNPTIYTSLSPVLCAVYKVALGEVPDGSNFFMEVPGGKHPDQIITQAQYCLKLSELKLCFVFSDSYQKASATVVSLLACSDR